MRARKPTESAGLQPRSSRDSAALEALRPQLGRSDDLRSGPRRRRLKPGQWWALFFDEFTEEGKRARADRAAQESAKNLTSTAPAHLHPQDVVARNEAAFWPEEISRLYLEGEIEMDYLCDERTGSEAFAML